MKMLNIMCQKRLPLTVGAMLTGVVIASFFTNVIESPQVSYRYLHEHLESSQLAMKTKWGSSDFELPPQDKVKIGQLIAHSESSNFIAGQDYTVTGQALKGALDTACYPEDDTCRIPVRINRQFKVTALNDDLRVANIEETSLRVDFETAQNEAETKFMGLATETRNLRFYQTQSGWVQNTAEIVNSKPFIFTGRAEQFNQIFDHPFVGLNYYPASASWKEFWTKFPVIEIKTDLEKAKRLKVNALRIFLTYDYFHESDSRKNAVAKLRSFLDLCENQNIQVLVTLFDLRPNYAVSNWASDIEHIDGVLSSISGHKAILGIDLKNQPDLDFPNWGEDRVQGWLTVMARHIQTQYPNLAVTAGWSTAENAARLHNVFDVVTYHEYQNPRNFKDRLQSIKAVVGEKPVMITELGSTIWRPPFIQSRTEAAQASRLNAQLRQADDANGIFVWTLNDFDHVGREVVGRLPWRQAQQRHFGLYRPDGSPRPSAAVLTAYGVRQFSQHSTKNFSSFNIPQHPNF